MVFPTGVVRLVYWGARIVLVHVGAGRKLVVGAAYHGVSIMRLAFIATTGVLNTNVVVLPAGLTRINAVSVVS